MANKKESHVVSGSVAVENTAQILWGALLLLYLAFGGQQLLHSGPVLAVFGASAAAALLELWLRRIGWRGLLAYDMVVWTVLLTAMVVVTGGRSSELWIAYLLMSLTAPTVERPLLCYGLLGFNSLLYALVYLLVNPHQAPLVWPLMVMRIGLFFLVAYVMERFVGREIRLRRQRVAELTGARDAERKRIAQELHDWLGQGIAAPLFKMEMAARHPERAPDSLAEAAAMLRRSHGDLRRLMEDLHPHLLEQMGLADALRAYVETWSIESAIHASYLSEGQAAPPPDRALAAYRMVQEALTNVWTHSGATTAQVQVTLAPGLIRLRVRDNGNAPTGVSGRGAAPGRGITGMRERAEATGGRFSIHTDETGTTVEALLRW